jgi:carbamoyl-phosphate synthase large subunit
MTKTRRVLFSSAGRRVELLNCFRQDAIELGIELKVLAADANSKMSAACQFADNAFMVPHCSDAGFIPALLEICQREKVELLIPTIDTELELLAQAREDFQKLGTLVAVSSVETVKICRDKELTAQVLGKNGISVPKTLSFEEFRADETALKFPIMLKPRRGSSSHGIFRITRREALPNTPDVFRNYIAQELCSGDEYTVNLYFDSMHRVRCAVPHRRIEMRSGEVNKGTTERKNELLQVANKLTTALPGGFGALCFQAILTPEPRVFEINARFGGGFPLAHQAGAKFSKWLLEQISDVPSSVNDDWESGLTMLRFDQSVFLRA